LRLALIHRLLLCLLPLLLLLTIAEAVVNHLQAVSRLLHLLPHVHPCYLLLAAASPALLLHFQQLG
jgi:hypothetical protein